VVVNTGFANACTGNEGYLNALAVCDSAQSIFQGPKDSALSLSTGVIGMQIPLEKIQGALKNWQSADTEPLSFAKAIMTTDLVPKYITKKILLGGKEVTITGFAKGSGMISPNMATMLGFVLTDLDISQAKLQKMLKETAQETFNCITVDGDMSTNDSLIVLANGQSKVKLQGSEQEKEFAASFYSVMDTLAQKVVEDGEGATKLIEIQVQGAKNQEDARKAGLAIANSPLVKTAFFGNDPNWGRILCAIGYSGAKVQEEKIELFYVDRYIFQGKPVLFDKKELSAKLKESKQIKIVVNLNQGKAQSKIYTCDLSYDYVKINADYTS
jgi:glutamate N-acetyltransferase/amino-acid N-acetyltransferase